ncbi:unnamed protein product [Schistosoma mattheei]|uniref:Uncharacterized protein n=1 Tax=Schistosoma mattheei TaxID=31246 RepID=A0A183PQG2_9TREM|nr:unnamed protein product [Schistosoma mattheei]
MCTIGLGSGFNEVTTNSDNTQFILSTINSPNSLNINDENHKDNELQEDNSDDEYSEMNSNGSLYSIHSIDPYHKLTFIKKKSIISSKFEHSNELHRSYHLHYHDHDHDHDRHHHHHKEYDLNDEMNKSKKPRKSRTAFTDLQLNELEKMFDHQKYLSVQDRIELAERLHLTDTQVKTWTEIDQSLAGICAFCVDCLDKALSYKLNKQRWSYNFTPLHITKWKRQTAVGFELLAEAGNFVAVQLNSSLIDTTKLLQLDLPMNSTISSFNIQPYTSMNLWSTFNTNDLLTITQNIPLFNNLLRHHCIITKD